MLLSLGDRKARGSAGDAKQVLVSMNCIPVCQVEELAQLRFISCMLLALSLSASVSWLGRLDFGIEQTSILPPSPALPLDATCCHIHPNSININKSQAMIGWLDLTDLSWHSLKEEDLHVML